MAYETAIIAIGAAVLAGVSWNVLGIWNNWRNGRDAAIDWKKVRKNVIIGVVLGIVAYIYNLSQGGNAVAITDVNTFFLAVSGFFPLIIIAEKIFTKKEDTDEEED